MTRQRVTLVCAAALLLANSGCKPLESIEENECGNRVVESPEDCDGADVLGVACRPPGSLGECRLDCSPGLDGRRPGCPPGWACSAETYCRPLTGAFNSTGELIAGNADTLLSGDLDGDGRADIVSLEPRGSLGASKVRAHYFSNQGRLVETWSSEKPMAVHGLRDVTGDGLADLAVSFGNPAVLAGTRERAPLPVAFPSYYLAETDARTYGVFDGPIAQSAALVIVTRYDGEAGLFVSDAGTLRSLAGLPGGIEELAAEPVVGDLFDDESQPCADLVLAFGEARELSVYSPCEFDPDDGSARWRERIEPGVVTLEPETVVEGGLLLADFDGNGHTDILVGTAGGPYLSLGDGSSLDSARPFSITVLPNGSPLGEVPLAAGDLNGDGLADLVLPDGVVFSQPEHGLGVYQAAWTRFGTPWTEAIIADLTGDGEPDLAACSSQGLDVDFFNGTGQGRINSFTVPTARPVEHLSAGDFDGDLVGDLAFTDLAGRTSEQRIFVAFGRSFGAPEAPQAIATLDNVRQLASFRSEPYSTISHLIVPFAQEAADQSERTALALLVGSGDRSLWSPIELSTFATDGLLRNAFSLVVAAGHFVEDDRIDLFTLGPFDSLTSEDYAFWLVPEVALRRTAPRNLGWDLGPGAAPLVFGETTAELTIALATGDLDADGLDEVALAVSYEEDRCLFRTSKIIGADEPTLYSDEPLVLDHPCDGRLQLEISDLDGDGDSDVVFLAGGATGEASLYVLWNDGSGRFAAATPDQPLFDDEHPRAFALLSRADEVSRAIAYVTQTSLRRRRSLGEGHGFSEPEELATLSDGTGIAAADVDGDGAVDLTIADARNVRLLRAGLVQ